MKLSAAWLTQIGSDQLAAERVYDALDYRTYCQAIAKHQQVVEKLIKATAAILYENGISLPTDHDHYPRNLILKLRRLPRKRGTASVYGLLSDTFSNQRSADIGWICSLAPKLPDKKGDPLKRNTEYPFHRHDGTWCAPAEPDVFSNDEVARCSQIAKQLFSRVERINGHMRRGAF